MYQQRWQVEVDFRDLKSTLTLKHLRSRSVAGVRKELAAFVILYNLIRLTMRRSARLQQVEPNRISFIDTARWLLWSAPGAEPEALLINPKRKRPTEPRALKDYRRNYSRLSKPRVPLQRPAAVAML